MHDVAHAQGFTVPLVCTVLGQPMLLCSAAVMLSLVIAACQAEVMGASPDLVQMPVAEVLMASKHPAWFMS